MAKDSVFDAFLTMFSPKHTIQSVLRHKKQRIKLHVKDQTQNRRDAACCVRKDCKGYMPSGRCTQRPYKLFGYKYILIPPPPHYIFCNTWSLTFLALQTVIIMRASCLPRVQEPAAIRPSGFASSRRFFM